MPLRLSVKDWQENRHLGWDGFIAKMRSQQHVGNVALDTAQTESDTNGWLRVIDILLARGGKKATAKVVTPAVAVDHRADDDALANLVRMKPAARATAFQREARGERVGLNDKLVELRERLEIPEGEEEQQRNAIKDFWNGLHQRNTLNNDLKL